MTLPTSPSPSPQPKLNLDKNLKLGLYILAVFLLTFGVWAFFTKIESAAVAQGRVSVDTNRKNIQHLQGGRIKEILIKEGDFVKTGTPLIQLDQTQEKNEYDALKKEQIQILATKARYDAILDNETKITFPDEIINNWDLLYVQDSVRREEAHFVNHQKFIDDQVNIQNKLISKLLSTIETSLERLKFEKNQLALIQEEETEVKKLREENLVSKPRLLALQREGQRLEGSISTIDGTIQEAKKDILRAKAERDSIVSKDREEVSRSLTDLDKRLFDVEGKLASLKDILDHSLIVSPIDGSIVDLRFHTIGGIIKPGDLIMSIVPIHDKMVVEAQVSPLDIDVVHPGLKAKVDFLPYVKQRNVPIMNGEVTIVSADVFTDEKTGHSFYRVYIEIPPSELEKATHVKLYPGMPVQVMIINDTRTPFEYFMTPITNSFKRAFREK